MLGSLPLSSTLGPLVGLIKTVNQYVNIETLEYIAARHYIEWRI